MGTFYLIIYFMDEGSSLYKIHAETPEEARAKANKKVASFIEDHTEIENAVVIKSKYEFGINLSNIKEKIREGRELEEYLDADEEYDKYLKLKSKYEPIENKLKD